MRNEVVEVSCEQATAKPSGRVAHIGIAARCFFIVIVYPDDPAALPTAVADLRAGIEDLVADARSGPRMPLPGGSGGSSSGPAELPLVELGITVPRTRN